MANASIARGGQFAGNSAGIHSGYQYDGRFGARYSGTYAEGPESLGVRPRGIAYAGGGDVPGAQYAPTAPSLGGTHGIPDASVESLIETDGFALVLEKPSGADRLGFTPEDPAYRTIQSVQWTTEVNKAASWRAKVPANDDLFDWPFSDAVIAYDGERRFHGILLPVESGQFSDGEFQIGGYGPLYWARHGDLTLRYSDTAAWRALQDVWLQVARATSGRVRGNVVRPRPSHAANHTIPETGVEFTGTPMKILQEAHGYAGMAFSTDHSEPGGVFQSFVPATELRSAEWRPKSINPSVNPEGYHNRVTVIGDMNPVTGESYRASVSAPQTEIQQVAGGRILERVERNPEFQSDEECHARAATLLAEDRGKYTIGGSLDVAPGVRRVVPGYTYRISEFDTVAPAMFSPVWATLRSVSENYGVGEATVSLSFEDESGILQHIREDLLPETAPMTVARRDEQMQQADPNYDAPTDLVFEYGRGAWGSALFGAAGNMEDTN